MSFNPAFEPVGSIQGAYILDLPTYSDSRGIFSELWRSGCDFEQTIRRRMVQWNQSFSRQGILRGMHIQSRDPQGKLITCLHGRILDSIVDLRPKSPTFLGTFSTFLFPGKALYAPPGCAHGFLVLSFDAIVHYGCTSFHNPEFDGGVRWDSPELGDWPSRSPVLSPKDAALPLLRDYVEQRKSDLLDIPAY